MDSNSLPMPVELEAFPRVVRLPFVDPALLSVGLFVLAVVVGLLAA